MTDETEEVAGFVLFRVARAQEHPGLGLAPTSADPKRESRLNAGRTSEPNYVIL